MRSLLEEKYATQLGQDLQILDRADLPWRTYLAVTHRTAQKEALLSQLRLLSILAELLERVKTGTCLKDAYMQELESEKGPEEILRNRIRLRNYFKELNYYSTRVLSS